MKMSLCQMIAIVSILTVSNHVNNEHPDNDPTLGTCTSSGTL